jgi:hypothetical protein
MSNPPLMAIRLRCEYSCLGGPTVKILRGAVGAIAVLGAAGSVATAAPLVPATMSMGSAAVSDVTPVQWQGRDGGTGVAAGLATGPIIGGQLAAPRYYEPYYPPRYGDPSDMAVLTGRLIAFHHIVHSIRSAERIKVATAGDTIASNRRYLTWTTDEMEPPHGSAGIEGRLFG